MKSYTLIFALVIAFTTSCKSKKEASSSTSTSTNKEATPATPKVTGKVSHQYRASGCATVVIVSSSDGDIILIPKDKLAKELDVDGMQISFNYITLKMPQPEGCTAGIPADLTGVSKK